MNDLVKAYLAKIGKKGGRVTSPEKTASCRENASRPRPNARGKRKKETK